MALVFSDVEIVISLLVALIIVYIVGTYWKHRILTRYAHRFEEKFSSKGKVKYASYGHAGLRIRCEMNSPTDGFKELQFAVSLGARENLIYYLYAPLARDFDRLNCWGFLDKPVRFRLKIERAGVGKKHDPAWETGGMDKVELPDLQNLGYAVFCSSRDYATQLLQRARLVPELKGLSIESLELEVDAPRLHLVARLRENELSKVFDFISLVGRSA